jgi:hypothetical protein
VIMPFINPPRTLQRYRKMFKCQIVGPEGAADALGDLVIIARRVTSQLIGDAIEANGGEWIASTHRRERADVYKDLIASFDANGLPTASGPSQMFAAKDRADDLAFAPLVFGNRAKTLKGQQEVEVFVRGTSLALKCGKTDKAKTINVELDEVPGENWFVQSAEVLPNATINLVVVRSHMSVERDKAEGKTGKKKKTKKTRKAVKADDTAFVMIGKTLYAVDADGERKIRSRFVSGKTVDDEMLDRVREWIRKNGEVVAEIEVIV